MTGSEKKFLCIFKFRDLCGKMVLCEVGEQLLFQCLPIVGRIVYDGKRHRE